MTRARSTGALRRSFAGAVAAAFALPVLLAAGPVHAEPIVTVTPNQALRDGDRVQVNVTGMPPSTPLAIGICQVGRPATGPGDCADSTLSNATLAQSDPAGNASAVLRVFVGPARNSTAPQFRCGPQHPCEVRVSTLGGAAEAVATERLNYAGAPGDPAPQAPASEDGSGGGAADDEAVLGETGLRDVIVLSLVGVLLVQIGLVLRFRGVRSPRAPRR